MADQWRDVSGYDGIYQVSDRGHVRNTHTSKILQPTRMKNGRLYVTLSSDGFQRKCTVHGLVAASFLADCPAAHETTHKDGDHTHNAASNLEYVTRRENQKRHAVGRIFRQSHEAGSDREWHALLPRRSVRKRPS